MQGSESTSSPDYLEKELEEGGAMHGSMVSDADSDELPRQRRTLFAACMYALLKTTPALGDVIDDSPHSSNDFGHRGGNPCFRCNLKELNRATLTAHSVEQYIESLLFVCGKWQPKMNETSLASLLNGVLMEIQSWCLEKDYEKMSSTSIRFSYQSRLNDLFWFDSSTKWGCYSCDVHFSTTTYSNYISVDGRSLNDFLKEQRQEQYMDCHECRIPTAYKHVKLSYLPQTLIFLEASKLPPHISISNQNYGLACVMPDKKKAYLYCLFETKNWAKVDMAEARAVSFSSEAPELPDSVAIAFYTKIR